MMTEQFIFRNSYGHYYLAVERASSADAFIPYPSPEMIRALELLKGGPADDESIGKMRHLILEGFDRK